MGVEVEDINNACYPKVGLLFELVEKGSYRPLPKHLRNFEEKIRDCPEVK